MSRARKELSQLFSKVIQARRASGTQEDDVLQVIASAALTSAMLSHSCTQHPCDMLSCSHMRF